MAADRKYTRIPPESTGDRIVMVHTAEIEYTGLVGNHVWNTSDGLDYRITGAPGDEFDIHVHGVYQTGTSGRLSVHFSEIAREEKYDAKVGQLIQYYDTVGSTWVTAATVAQSVQAITGTGSFDLYIPAQNIVGGNNPENKLDVDRFGSAQVTFSEGTPELTGFGSLKINDARLLASYDFSLDKQPQQFVNSNEGNNSYVIWDGLAGATWPASQADGITNRVALHIDGGVKPSRATHTSNLFHSYIAGSGILYVFGAMLAGEDTYVVRNWGAFDATDGYFFQKNDDTLNVVHRNTAVLGAGNDMTVPQGQWNVDTMDGTGGDSNPSGYTLNVNTPNTYWIDYQFLGGGRTRWGIVVNGKRLTCHEMYHSNGEGMISTTNPLTNPNRPLCWAIACPAAKPAAPAAESFIYALGGGVWLESDVDPLLTAQQYSYAGNRTLYKNPNEGPAASGPGFIGTYQSDGDAANTAVINSGLSSNTSTQYLFTISPRQFYNGTGTPGKENHSVYQPLKAYVSAYDQTNGNPTPIQIRVFSKCIMRGLEWGSGGLSAPTVQVDTKGDHIAHGPQIARVTVRGEGELDFSSIGNVFQYNTVRNKSDQPFSRISQPITSFDVDADKYGIGGAANSVVITVGTHPEWGTSDHYFEDRQPIAIANTTGGTTLTNATWTNGNAPDIIKSTIPTGYASSDYVDAGQVANWYYMSMINDNQMWIYDTLADIDDDRTVRIVNVDNLTNVNVGDTFTVGQEKAVIMHIGQYDDPAKGNVNDVWLCQRTSGVNTDYAGSFSTSSGGSGTSTLAGLDSDGNITSDGLNNYSDHKDYWTSVNAVKASDIYTSVGANLTDNITSGLVVISSSPPRQAWTFMATNLASNYTNDSTVRINVQWRERNQ